MDKILRNTNIWDLHIHTPLGTPTKKNYGNASTEEFIDTIIDIYNKSNNKIGMISFTDHNKINADAYELFKIKSDIAIIPGIEVDVYLSEKDKDSKHIIFYFDEEELENIRELKTLVEDYIESNEKVIFEDFIMYLVVKRKRAKDIMGGKRILEQAIEFEGIVNNIFKEAGYETNTFDYYRDHLYDIEAKKGEETYCIEIKFMNNKNRAPLSLYKKAITKLINATDKKSGIPVFVVSGLLERKEKEFLKQREDVQILDISNLLYSVEDNDKLTNQLISFLPYSVMDIVSQKCFVKIDSLQHGGYAKSLIKELELINAGRDDFNKYEDVCMKILQYIFEDDLTLWLSQAKSNEDLYRFDCLCRIKNNNEKEFWTILERYFNTKYIVFEFKNYSEKISQREIYTTERYLYAKALRSVAIIIAKNDYDDNSVWAVKGCLRENGKLIILLNIEDIKKMYKMKEENDDPSIYLMNKLDMNY